MLISKLAKPTDILKKELANLENSLEKQELPRQSTSIQMDHVTMVRAEPSRLVQIELHKEGQ